MPLAERPGKSAVEFAETLKSEYHVLVQGRPPYDIRAVFHRHISKQDTESIAKAILTVAGS